MVESPPAVQERQETQGSIPGSGRSPGEGNSNPLQYACLGGPTGREAWWAAVHGLWGESAMPECAHEHTHTHTHTHCLLKYRPFNAQGEVLPMPQSFTPLSNQRGAHLYSLESSPAFTQTSTWCWYLPVATILVNCLSHMPDDNRPKSGVTHVCFYSSTWILTPSRDSASCKTEGRREEVAGREGGTNKKHSGIPGWKKLHRSPNESLCNILRCVIKNCLCICLLSN